MSGNLTPRINSNDTTRDTNDALVELTNRDVLSITCPSCRAAENGHCLVKVKYGSNWVFDKVHYNRVFAYNNKPLPHILINEQNLIEHAFNGDSQMFETHKQSVDEFLDNMKEK